MFAFAHLVARTYPTTVKISWALEKTYFCWPVKALIIIKYLIDIAMWIVDTLTK